MKTSRVIRRCYTWLLRHAAPALDSRDLADAADDFTRLRAHAWQMSFAAWAAVWGRELRALAATWRDERSRRRSAFDPSRQHPLARVLATARDDLRHAARGLARQPVFTTVIVVTLALGIGANGAAFGLLDRFLVRGPDHVEAAGRLVRIYRRITTPPLGAQTSAWLPFQTYEHLRDTARGFSSMGAYGVRDTMVGAGADAKMRRVGMVLGSFFQTLESTPEAGRFLLADEDAATAGPLAIVSDELWRSDFGADPAAIGRSLLVDGASATIVGIAPRGFSGPEMGRVDAWLLGNTRTAALYNWKIVARLRGAVTVADASAEAARIHLRAIDDEPKWMGPATLLAAPIRFDETGREPVQVQMAGWMAGVSALILIVTWANVANLLIVRLARRRRELGIRVALGSGTGRVMRLVAFEGLLLALAGGCASVLVATLALGAVRFALFAPGSGWTAPEIDVRLLILLGAIALSSAAAVGVLPSLHAGVRVPVDVLRQRSDAGPARTRVRAVLTVVQAAISVVLLAGAGLFLVSLRHVAMLDLGTQPDRVIVVEARVDRPGVPADRAAFQRFLDDFRAREREAYVRALDAVRHVAGVQSAAITLGLPFDNGSFGTTLEVPGMDRIPALPGGGPYISAVGDEYFRTIGTRILRGRPFGPDDRANSEAVTIVSATTAARLWPSRDALGACIRIGGSARCARIVGIAEDVHRVSLREEPSLQVYVPFGQEHGFAGARLIVRPATNSAVSAAAVRHAIAAVDPDVRLVDLHLLSEPLDSELQPLRIGMTTFGASAALAVLTASLGLYGLMSYVVAWRRREIGIRLALGATEGQIRRLVLGNGMSLAAIGTACGLFVTLIAGRWIQSQLFDTSAADPIVLASVSFVVLAVAAAAGVVPSRRAVHISPAESMRTE